MNKLLLLAGAAVCLTATPALADPGKNKNKAKAHSSGFVDVNRNNVPDWRERTRADVNMNGVPDYRERRLVDINRNGVPDWRERWMDMNRDGIDDRQQIRANRFGGAICPPGLAKRTPACVPPGQVGKSGGPVPAGWDYLNYSNIPADIRTRYNLDDDDRYVYRDRRLYVVDPTTNLITRVLNAIRF